MDHSEPLISIIIPTYNRGYYIPNAIETAARQTYRNIEIIVVDDGSYDETLATLQQQALTEPRLRIVAHKENQGVSAARNMGIRNSKGTYIAFLDSDDLWEPQKLQMQMAEIGKGGTDAVVLCMTNMLIHGIHENNDKITTGANRRLDEHIIRRGTFSPSTWLVSRKTFEKVGDFDTKLHCLEDLDWQLRLLQQGGSLRVVKEPLTQYFFNSKAAYKDKAGSLQRFLEKHSDWVNGHYRYDVYNTAMLKWKKAAYALTSKPDVAKRAILALEISTRKLIHETRKTFRAWRRMAKRLRNQIMPRRASAFKKPPRQLEPFLN